tara:strand:+ start:196 stop:552 length:357 start_codon:yes stop_codon:yes gene_type:complete
MKRFSIFLSLSFVTPIIIGFLVVFITCPIALAIDSGEEIFSMHCSGCHINGGNIIRRSKNLKLSTLHRNGLDDVDSIARIAREGIGIMSGYKEVLKEGEDKLVSDWILQQAQNAWIHG